MYVCPFVLTWLIQICLQGAILCSFKIFEAIEKLSEIFGNATELPHWLLTKLLSLPRIVSEVVTRCQVDYGMHSFSIDINVTDGSTCLKFDS